MAKSKRIGSTSGRFVNSNISKSTTSNLRYSNRESINKGDLVESIKGSNVSPRSRNMNKTGATSKKFNITIYRQLLVETVPKVIESQDEYDRIEAKFERLLDKADTRTKEEDALFDLLASLLQDYEKRTLTPLEPTSPISTLRFLMEQNGLNQIDLVEYFGSQGNVSQVLAGKRAISKGAAQKLSDRFKLSTDIFLKNM